MAPLLKFKLKNDVDGRDCVSQGPQGILSDTPLVDLSFRGIEAKVLSDRSSNGPSTLLCKAKVRSVDAVDLYQGAGDDFALLLSSVSPQILAGKMDGDRVFDKQDLVTLEYESGNDACDLPCSEDVHDTSAPSLVKADTLKVRFNELYVEWNPETLAAVQKAMNLPASVDEESEHDPDRSEDDFFFDAEEDDFQDAESVASGSEDSHMISEISTSCRSSFSDAGDILQQRPFLTGIVHSPLTGIVSQSRTLIGSPLLYGRPGISSPPGVKPPTRKPFEISFNLSKLRVSFNKESRHRRLFIAEMDRTSVRFSTRIIGGSRTLATIGNLSFSDADSLNDRTLYREILGLKTDAESSNAGPTSLLEMEIVVNPRSRRYISEEDLTNDDECMAESVCIDPSRNIVHGSDYSLKARFSEMKFVYLQQLWNEIVDYFFEAIIGYEVWGTKRPVPLPPTDVNLLADNADRVTFTRFDVRMMSPAILLPVSYCSTDFIRLEADEIVMANIPPGNVSSPKASLGLSSLRCVVTLSPKNLLNRHGPIGCQDISMESTTKSWIFSINLFHCLCSTHKTS